MHTFIATLASLSITGGVSAPLITNQVQDSNSIALPTTTPFGTTRVPLNGEQKLSPNQGHKYWEIAFDLPDGRGWDTKGTMRFEGGGLRASIGWGSDLWTYEWSSLAIDANSPNIIETLLDDHHTSGLAQQYAKIEYSFDYIISTGKYEVWFHFYTESINSFTGCWGNLVIGDGLVLTI